MKKIISIFTIFWILVAPVLVQGAGLAPDPNEVIFDDECARRLVMATTIPGTVYVPQCNKYCIRSIVSGEGYCIYGSENVRGGYWDVDLELPIQPGPVDAAFIYIRAALYAVMGAIAVAVILYGLYGWYMHAMSEGKPDKLEVVKKIYTNAVIGAIIVLCSFVVVQILATFFGVTESLFEMSFIPKSGFLVEVRDKDIGRVCFEEQQDKSSEGGTHTCVDGRWQ
jgi:hypothetical protein